MSGKTKKIGDYLLDNRACDRKTMDEALKKQSSLEILGQYKSMGEIMVEDGTVASEDLQRGLQEQWIDMLSTAELFQTLSEDQVRQIAGVAADRTIRKNTVLFSQGNPGDTYWLVISGEVRVYRCTNEGIEIELDRLQPGDGFGEMALLTGEPRSATVETVRASRFLVINKNDFDQMVLASPELSVVFTKILADRLIKGNVSLEKASVKELAFQRFISDYQTGPQIELIGRSRAIEKLRQQCSNLSDISKPVLLYGPPGTEKKSVSWHIHKAHSFPEKPFLFVDIKNLNLIRQSGPTSTSDPLQMELTQGSILFGHLQGSLSFAKTNRLGLLQVGNNGTVVIDNIEVLAPSMQDKLVAFMRSGRFLPLGSSEEICSTARIICCTSVDLQTMIEKDLFNKDLYGLLAEQTLQIPPLRHRKNDLGLLVDSLIAHYSRQLRKSVTGIDQEAYSEIMSYDWPGNMDELEIVVRRAINLAEKDKLAPADLFIGLTPTIGKLTFNLLRLDKVKKIFNSGWYPTGAQLMTGAFFLYIFYQGYWGVQRPDSNVSLVLTWGLWEPFVFISTLFAARIWCGVCPVGAASSLCSRHFSLKLPVPQLFRKYGFYVSGFGIALIFWSEVATHMIISPRATAYLLASIFGLAMVFGLLYQRRAWCRYLCPLGKMIGVFASTAMVELRANYGICNNDCITHTCYTGGDTGQSGCPMFEGPFSLRSNLNCILCGNCIKNCPNQSPQVNLRLPGFELWSSRRFEKPIAFLVLVIVSTQLFRGLEMAGYYRFFPSAGINRITMLFILFTAVTTMVFLAIRTVEKLMPDDILDNKEYSAGILSYCLLILTATVEMAFHLERLLLFGGQIIPVFGRQLGQQWEAFGASGAPWAITTLQVMLILVGGWGSLWVLKRIYRPGLKDRAEKSPLAGRLMIALTTCIYIFLFTAG